MNAIPKPEKILNYSPDTIKAYTVKQLHDLCKELGRNVIKAYSTLKKADLVQQLIDLYEREKLANEVKFVHETTKTLSETIIDVTELKITDDLGNEIRSAGKSAARYVFKELTSKLVAKLYETDAIQDKYVRDDAMALINLDLTTLISNCFLLFDKSCKVEQKENSSGTFIRDFRSELILLVSSVKDLPQAKIDCLLTLVKRFDGLLKNKFAELTHDKINKGKSKATQKRVDTATSSKNDLTLIPYIQQAYDILYKLDGRTHWIDVVYALIVSTGRRPAEIVATAEFRYISANKVLFSGQCKNQKRKHKNILEAIDKHLEDRKETEDFEIVTLVPAELVIKGMNWLNASRKRIVISDETFQAHKAATKQVNAKYGKLFSIQLDKLNVGYTFKDFRSLYAQACYILVSNGLIDNPFGDDKELFIATVLGHSTEVDEYGNKTFNLSSVSNYQDYRVTDETPIIFG